jgi:hypothetical protein
VDTAPTHRVSDDIGGVKALQEGKEHIYENGYNSIAHAHKIKSNLKKKGKQPAKGIQATMQVNGCGVNKMRHADLAGLRKC